MDTVIELYRPEDLGRLEQRYKRSGRAAAFLAGAALAVCILFCCLTNTANARVMELLTISVSTVSGWIVIWLVHHRVIELRRERRHAGMLLEEERSTLEGVVAVSGERMRIRGSIRFYPLSVTGEAGRSAGKVIASRAPLLRAENGKKLRLYVVNGYVAAFERL